jgi:hypothetical protein
VEGDITKVFEDEELLFVLVVLVVTIGVILSEGITMEPISYMSEKVACGEIEENNNSFELKLS